jgi:hypothetical protein
MRSIYCQACNAKINGDPRNHIRRTRGVLRFPVKCDLCDKPLEGGETAWAYSETPPHIGRLADWESEFMEKKTQTGN